MVDARRAARLSGACEAQRYVAEASTASRIQDKTITFIEDANGLRIIDGNKRAIAIYETAAPDIALAVFVLYPRGVTPPGAPVTP